MTTISNIISAISRNVGERPVEPYAYDTFPEQWHEIALWSEAQSAETARRLYLAIEALERISDLPSSIPLGGVVSVTEAQDIANSMLRRLSLNEPR